MLHWIGALLIIVSCAAIGFSMAAAHRKEETALRDLLQALEYMASDLQFRLTPLPELCRKAAASPKNAVGKVLKTLSAELEHQICPDVSSCMHAALFRCSDIPASLRNAFELLGNSLGQFDLDGQLRGIASVTAQCRMELERLSCNRDTRLRSYQTLGLCAGAALAILLI